MVSNQTEINNQLAQSRCKIDKIASGELVRPDLAVRGVELDLQHLQIAVLAKIAASLEVIEHEMTDIRNIYSRPLQ